MQMWILLRKYWWVHLAVVALCLASIFGQRVFAPEPQGTTGETESEQSLYETEATPDVKEAPTEPQTAQQIILYGKSFYMEPIPFETVYCYSAVLPEGYRQVVRPGICGKQFCIAQRELINGEEVSRTVTFTLPLASPNRQIEVVGTGENLKGHPDTPAVGDGILVTASGEILYFQEVITSHATAYNLADPGCGSTTATGTRVREGAIAVDPKVIPYFTEMFILSNDGKYVYGKATAEDCGGAINGTRIDLYYDTVEECNRFGRRDCTVYILTDEPCD